MAKNFNDTDSVMAPLRGGFDVTPSGTALAINTRVVMVTEDDTTITGIMIDQDSSHTTGPLKAGVMYPFQFKVISAVSAGSAKGYY